MDVYLHTFIAVGCIAAAFYAGRFFAKRSMFEDIVTQILSKLENDGWEKIGNIHTGDDNKDFRYNDSSRTRLSILSKDVKKGNLKINDYGSWGGIIVLTH